MTTHSPSLLSTASLLMRVLLAVTALAALATSARAQLQFAELPGFGLPVDTDNTRSVALGDVDGDGDLDVVCANDGQNRLYLNDGNGRFTDVTVGQMPAGGWDEVALGDVDADGDLDLVNMAQLYLNNGAGVFTDVTATQMPAGGGGPVALGDVDDDGDVDLVGPSRLYLNNGAGTFVDVSATQMPIAVGQLTCLALGDVDGDGDLDVVCGAMHGYLGVPFGQNRLYVNNGLGTFTDATSQLPISGDPTTAVSFGDVDGDGDLDLVTGEYYRGPGAMMPGLARLYINDGSGTFTDVTATHMAAHGSAEVLLADVDLDGDLDLLTGNGLVGYPMSVPGCGGSMNELHLNDGAGYFVADWARLPESWDITTCLVAGDLDGDGDLDVVCGNASSVPCLAYPQNRTYLNLRRQLHAPTAPRIGQFHALDAYLRYGPPSTVDLAAVYLSTAANSVALPPFGVLGIDPTAAVPFPTLLIPQPAGFGTVGFTVPYQPNLVGQAIFSQAMLVAYPNELRLSNVVREVVQTCLVPSVTAMPFTTGPAMGGGPFEVHGQNLLGATVTFGGVALTNITSQTATEIIGQVPPGAVGPATVVISNGLACQATATYTYHAIPTITSITPAVALPGAPVTIHGSNFLSGLSLAVDGNATPISSWTATTVSFQLPPGTGCDALVEVTNVGGFSASQLMNPTPVVNFSTAAGPATGNAQFIVSGQHLLGATVTFNGVPMTSVTNQTASVLIGLTPPGAVGPATVLISNALGCSATVPYTYQ